MDPVPYQIRPDDVDEVLGAYESVGGSWTDEERASARDHVMRNVLEIDDAVRTAPEDRRMAPRGGAERFTDRASDDLFARREMALAAIEDLLIRDGFIEPPDDDSRVFPVIDRGGSGEGRGDEGRIR